MLLFLVCALLGGRCPLPAPPALPIEAPIEAPITEGDTGPFWGIGQPWTGITDKDAGHCEGYDMPTGEGARPSLSWPVPGGVLHEGRGFRVGHTGYDIDAAEGSPVLAAAGGTVVWSGWSTWGFGLMVAVSHGGGWWTLYAHLSAVLVECGDWVGSGSPIGLVGMTGAATFFHCHFELKNGGWSWRPF